MVIISALHHHHCISIISKSYQRCSVIISEVYQHRIASSYQHCIVIISKLWLHISIALSVSVFYSHHISIVYLINTSSFPYQHNIIISALYCHLKIVKTSYQTMHKVVFPHTQHLSMTSTFLTMTLKIKVFVEHYAPGGNNVQKAIKSFKVKFKRSLT